MSSLARFQLVCQGILLGGVLGCLPGAIASAQTTPTPAVITSDDTIFEDVTLTPNFTPNPVTVHGISGGSIPASEIAGRDETSTGLCIGFVDEEPDHVMTLTQFFDYLKLDVEGSGDTSLVIRGPGGSWCNDNFGTLNPGIEGQWFSGTYEIWIGSPTSDTYYPYVLHLSGSSSNTP
jgi:hypothetical protein